MLNVAGLYMTYHNWKSGNISDTEAAIDGTFGVLGLIPHPATIGVSILYFTGKGALEASGKDVWNYRFGTYGRIYNSKKGR